MKKNKIIAIIFGLLLALVFSLIHSFSHTATTPKPGNLVPILVASGGRIKTVFLYKTEISNGEFLAYAANNLYYKYSLDKFSKRNHPVSFVSANEAHDFCKWLEMQWKFKGVIPTSWEIRIPLEEEWKFFFEEIPDQNEIELYAWGRENSDGVPKRVGISKANKLGVYDLLGNVSEWIMTKDKESKTPGKFFTRGGNFSTLLENCRDPFLGGERDPESKNGALGFRFVVDTNPKL